MLRFTNGWFIVGITSMLLGCSSSSSGDGSGSGFTSSVSSAERLSALSDAECAQLQTDLGKTSDLTKVNDFLCRVVGVLGAVSAQDQSDSGLQTACQSAYSVCIDGGGLSETTTSFCANKPTAACTATVGEYEACVNDTSAQVSKLSAQLPTCSALKASSLQSSVTTAGNAESSFTTPSCQTLNAKCPDLDMSNM